MDRPLPRPIFFPTPSPARPPQAAERQKETTGVRGAAVKRPAFGHGMPCPYGSKNELPTSCKTARLATAQQSRVNTVNADTVHVAATDARIGLSDSKLKPKFVGPYITKGAVQKRFGVSVTA